LCEQEIITLARTFSLGTKKEYDYQSIATAIQDNLRKHNFELFQKLKEALLSSDSYDSSNDSLSSNDARCVCKGFKLPIPDYLLDMLFE
jgi:hypothetical protein